MFYDVEISCKYVVTVEAESESEAMEIAPLSEDYDLSSLYDFDSECILAEYETEEEAKRFC